MYLLVIFIAAIILMILAMSKWKIHPFIAIMLTSLFLGLLAGIPLVDYTDGNTKIPGLVTVIGQGFSSIFTSIGIVIILGALIGAILEETGSALKLADMIIRLVGKHRPVLAMELMGWVVSIPVFCDSGFVVLNPIRRALVQRTGASSVSMTVALAAGLFLSHVFIPPTPGPLACASTLGLADNLLMVMGFGIVCSIFPIITAYVFARHIGHKIQADDETELGKAKQTYEEIRAKYNKLPNGWLAIAPILIPILLMALSSIINAIGLKGQIIDFVCFLSTPMMALTVGVCLAVLVLFQCGKYKQLNTLTGETLKTVGPILFITAAGGVLGKVISSSDMTMIITTHADMLRGVGILFPFLLAALFKTSMGSSTVAIITTAGIISPMLPSLGLATPVQATLTCMAIGAGSMTVSHANDSYFWVVTNFGAMNTERGYHTHTLCTLIMGLSAIIEIFILSLIF